MSSGMEPTQIAALNRPFMLGMLYNMHKDELIPGITLWNSEKLIKNVVITRQAYSDVDFLTEDNLQTKTKALGVDGTMKLSIIGGLVSLSGSAKFAYDRQETNHQKRVTLKYSATTHFEQLAMEHLGESNLEHQKILGTTTATHVVTGIVYGADAYFVFDQSISSEEKKKEIGGTFEAMIKKIPKCEIGGDAKINWTDTEKKCIEKSNFKFYGDFSFKENPKTLEEAIKLYGSLPEKLDINKENSVAKNENSVPKKVYLYPLHLLDNKMSKALRDISSTIVDYCIGVLEDLRSFIVEATDLTKSSTFVHFSQLKKQLLNFIYYISSFERDLKNQMAILLPQVRAGNSEETVLFDLFRNIESTPYSRRKLASWLQEKTSEIKIINAVVENITDDQSLLNISFESSSIDNCLGNINSHYTFYLAFHLNEEEEKEPQLVNMNNYLFNKEKSQSPDPKVSSLWFKNRQSLLRIRTNIALFKELARENILNKELKFIVFEEYLTNDDKRVDLGLYEDGWEKENYIIPSKPSAPSAITVTHNSVQLVWRDAESGSEPILKYKIMFRKTNAKEETKWSEMFTNDKKKEICIRDLPSVTSFQFKVQGIDKICHGPVSCVSELITTATTPLISKSKFTIREDERNEAYAGYYLEKAGTINVLLLGSLCMGKTSIVEALINPKYFKSCTGFNLTRSPTLQSLILYDELTSKLYQLNIIDTPGLAEIHSDHANRRDHQILSLPKIFTEQNISFINCICMVLEAGRVNQSDIEVVDQCIDFLGEKFSKNTMIVMTHADHFRSTRLHQFGHDLRDHPKTQKLFNYCKLGICYTGLVDQDDFRVYEDEGALCDLITKQRLRHLIPLRQQLVKSFISTVDKPIPVTNLGADNNKK